MNGARGHKPGGFNTSAVQPPFDSERLDAVEAGIKRTSVNGRVRVNASIFDYDYRNMQLDTPPSDAALGTFPIVINAAKASITGADIELRFVTGRRSLFTIGAVWLDAAFDRFVSRDPNNPDVDPPRERHETVFRCPARGRVADHATVVAEVPLADERSMAA